MSAGLAGSIVVGESVAVVCISAQCRLQYCEKQLSSAEAAAAWQLWLGRLAAVFECRVCCNVSAVLWQFGWSEAAEISEAVQEGSE